MRGSILQKKVLFHGSFSSIRFGEFIALWNKREGAAHCQIDRNKLYLF